jgi:hypothetical protein
MFVPAELHGLIAEYGLPTLLCVGVLVACALYAWKGRF